MIDLVAVRALAERPTRSPVGLLDPPFCYGPWRGPRLDLPVLEVRAKARLAEGYDALVLSDIPDDEDSLQQALALPGVLGALAVACGWLDLWVGEEVASACLAAGASVRRDGGGPRVEVRDEEELRRVWGVLEQLAAPPAPLTGGVSRAPR